MVRVLAVADSDSYLKWSSATLRMLPPTWDSEQVLVSTPITPSTTQAVAASGEVVPVLSWVALARKLIIDRPDVLLLGCTGPVVDVLLTTPWLRHGRRRPVLVTGLPGISVPATARAVHFRAACDLMVVHSHREAAEFSALCTVAAPGMAVGLARLPYLADPPPTGSTPGTEDPEKPPAVVFASQAKVPASREQRREVLLALAGGASTRSPLVKLRAESGEEQTHRETWPYPALWAELVAEGLVKPDAVRFSTGAMSDALHEAAGLATISSTAVLEAIAAGVPVLAISDFGVSPELINVVFEGSGCLGTLDDLRHGRFRVPDQAWLTDNYFHPATDDTWFDILSALLTQRRAGLPGRSVSRYGSRSAQLRRSLRLVLPRRFWSSASR